MALMQITVIPLGTKTTSVGDFIADIQRFLEDQDIDHTLNDMGTVLSGDIDELLRLVGIIHSLPFSRGTDRIITQIVIDDRRDCDRKIGEKTQSVLKRLNRE